MHDPLVLALVDSPWGPVRICAGPRGVVALALLTEARAFAAGLARRGLADPVPLEHATGSSADLAARAAAAVEGHLAGTGVDLSAFPVDIADRPAWDRLVLSGVRTIPRGSTASYGEVARRIGRPGAARAVGGAVARNPVGLLVPCHRVIPADGSLGEYGVATYGGREAARDLKRSLLALEGVDLP